MHVCVLLVFATAHPCCCLLALRTHLGLGCAGWLAGWEGGRAEGGQAGREGHGQRRESVIEKVGMRETRYNQVSKLIMIHIQHIILYCNPKPFKPSLMDLPLSFRSRGGEAGL